MTQYLLFVSVQGADKDLCSWPSYVVPGFVTGETIVHVVREEAQCQARVFS